MEGWETPYGSIMWKSSFENIKVIKNVKGLQAMLDSPLNVY